MNILPINYNDPEASQKFVESMKTTGFGVLTNTKVNKRLIDAVYKDFASFFASEDKFLHLFDEDVQAGYFPMNLETAKGSKVADIKEFYHYYPNRINSILRGDKISPYVPKLCWQLEKLSKEVLDWLEKDYADHLGYGTTLNTSLFQHNSNAVLSVNTFINSKFNWAEKVAASQSTLFRVLHYPPLGGDEAEGAIRAAAHGDINFITTLPVSTAPGLQVLDLEGRWHDVGTDENSVIFNVGDMLELLTEKYYRSTVHRVVNPSAATNVSRYSMPLFLHPHSDVRLSSNLTAGEFLQQRLRELKLK